jgi:hypothetical protein
MWRLLAVALVALTLAACGGAPPAPALATLPLAGLAGVIATAPGGSQVDPVHDHNRYRYVALGGPAHTSSASFIAAQVQAMRNRGWTDERSVGFRGTTTVAQPVAVTSAGAEVLLNAPNGSAYAAMQLVPAGTGADAQTSRTPLWHDPRIATALRQDRPVLWVVLGHGTHP